MPAPRQEELAGNSPLRGAADELRRFGRHLVEDHGIDDATVALLFERAARDFRPADAGE